MIDFHAIKAQHKQNREAGAVQIPEMFLRKFPDMKLDKASKLFDRYLDVVLAALIRRLPFLRDGETYVSTEALLNDCSTFNYNKERYWLWNEFKDIYPFFIVTEKGSNLKVADNLFEKNSKVKIVSERLLEMMLHEKSATSVFRHFYSEEEEEAISEVVYIDMDNLRRFIGCTHFELENAEAVKHRAKLQANLYQAILIEKIGEYTEETYGTAMLPMIAAPSAYGRTYYKGMNIQNVSKQVRSAILGRHFQYDMNAAVFAIKLYLYGSIMGGDNAIAGTLQGTYTRQYLAEKKATRNRLAKECFIGIDIPWDSKVKAIKNALTAIGFGAKTSGKTWMGPSGMQGTALTDILTSLSVRNAFLDDDWVKAFLAEQREIESVILENAETLEGYDEMVATIREGNGVNGRANTAGKLAFMYQHQETHIMDIAMSALAAAGIEPIARIHDAFIVRDKLPNRVLDEISALWGLRDYLTLDCEEVQEWVDPQYKRATARADVHLEAHRRHIEQEEAKAQKKAALKLIAALKAGAA